jgi:release factor glutamine methyltransferase
LVPHPPPNVVATLAAAGCVAADEEAAELMAAARGDSGVLGSLVERRVAGEPLAWITGRTRFAGIDLRVDPGVYVPRWQSTQLATRAARQLPEEGAAIDLCTGCGALAAVLSRARPGARVVATDTDPRAVANARANGVDTRWGDLFGPLDLSGDLLRRTDVVVAVVPYVPSPALRLLPRDTLTFEDVAHYDGGPDGAALLRRVALGAPRFLRPGGVLLLELGGTQAELLRHEFERAGYVSFDAWSDDDGDVRGIEARYSPA